MIQHYMLDTNTVSHILKGKSPEARARLAGLPQDHVACISVITEAELMYGLEKSASGIQRFQALDWFLRRLKVHPWGRDEAVAYGKLRAKQEATGKTLGPLDTLIAAHAVSIRAFLVTSDKAFLQITDLVGVENWAKDRLLQTAKQ